MNTKLIITTETKNKDLKKVISINYISFHIIFLLVQIFLKTMNIELLK